MKLGRLAGVERPAITCRMPSRTQDFILIDAGANAVAEAINAALVMPLEERQSRHVALLGRVRAESASAYCQAFTAALWGEH